MTINKLKRRRPCQGGLCIDGVMPWLVRCSAKGKDQDSYRLSLPVAKLLLLGRSASTRLRPSTAFAGYSASADRFATIRGRALGPRSRRIDQLRQAFVYGLGASPRSVTSCRRAESATRR